MRPDPLTPGEERADGIASRRDFLLLAAAVGLLGPAAGGCRGTVGTATADASAAATAQQARPPEPPALDSSYLARGLVAMSDAHQRGWVQGHLGAAVLSSCYFGREHALDERTSRALRTNVDGFIARYASDFPPANPGPGRADPARIVEQLGPHIGELRSGGHNTIFAALALRALRDLPEFATPAVVDGICRLVEAHANTARRIPDTRYNLEHPLPPYRGPEDVAEVTLRATLRPWGHVRSVGASGVMHWVTHAESLVTLEELGYVDLARRGHAAHQLHINRPVCDDGSPAPERAPNDWLGAEYWESDRPRRALGGSWLFGHSFKLPYSLFRLLRRIDDPGLRTASLARATQLGVPFE